MAELIRSNTPRGNTNIGRPDRSKPFFPRTSAQKVAIARKKKRRGEAGDAGEIVARVVLSASETQLLSLLESFHTLDSRVRTSAILKVRSQHVTRAERFQQRFEG